MDIYAVCSVKKVTFPLASRYRSVSFLACNHQSLRKTGLQLKLCNFYLKKSFKDLLKTLTWILIFLHQQVPCLSCLNNFSQKRAFTLFGYFQICLD